MRLDQKRECVFSSCRKYRYSLKIVWDAARPVQMFIGLNPSTADEENDDPTVRRWLGFAHDWGAGGVIICNAFAYRSTDWTVLRKVEDPIGGAENDRHILFSIIASDSRPVACWGGNAAKVGDGGRGDAIRKLGQFECLGTNGDGSPKHPLYLRADTVRRPWNYEI